MSKKILIAEDEHSLAKMLKNKFKRHGFKVVCTFNGKEAFKKIKSEKPDLVLLDIVMPEQNGFLVLEEMKKFKSLNRTIVIVLSNLGQEKDIEKAKALGADDYIIKSNLSMQEIVEKVNEFFKKHVKK